MLFSIWQRSSLGSKTPADIRYEVEVDAQTRLPNHSRVYLDVGQEDWELVSELNYLDYNVPLADELFAVADDAIQPLTESVRNALSFPDPFVPWNRTFYMPLDGMDIIVHPPSDDPSKGIGGLSFFHSRGHYALTSFTALRWPKSRGTLEKCRWRFQSKNCPSKATLRGLPIAIV